MSQIPPVNAFCSCMEPRPEQCGWCARSNSYLVSLMLLHDFEKRKETVKIKL